MKKTGILLITCLTGLSFCWSCNQKTSQAQLPPAREAAAQAHLRRPQTIQLTVQKSARLSITATTNKIFAIGASIGGVDALSVVQSNLPCNAVGAILTGMGADGVQGLPNMRHNGAPTVARDEDTWVVFGMPGAALALSGAERIAPL